MNCNNNRRKNVYSYVYPLSILSSTSVHESPIYGSELLINFCKIIPSDQTSASGPNTLPDKTSGAIIAEIKSPSSRLDFDENRVE